MGCQKCRERLGLKGCLNMEGIIYCDTCEEVKRKRDFADDMIQRWQMLDDTEDIQCKKCTGESSGKGRSVIAPRTYRCMGKGCSDEQTQKAWSELHFLDADLLEAKRLGESANVTFAHAALCMCSCNCLHNVIRTSLFSKKGPKSQ